MGDIVSPEKRSEMMSGIRGKDTKPEMMIRSGLHNLGFRYKLHDRALPGKPDLKFTKYNAVVFVHGCFWHKHDCHLFKMPLTRSAFWEKKFESNTSNDKKNMEILAKMGWRIAIIWECALRGKKSI
ncbi:MAG: very short patch repair endonuclease, partial [Crocinitomicaceae bacterium]